MDISLWRSGSVVCKEFTLDLVHKFFIGEFFFIVVDHRESVGLEFIFLEFVDFTDEVDELYDFSALVVVVDGFTAGF